MMKAMARVWWRRIGAAVVAAYTVCSALPAHARGNEADAAAGIFGLVSLPATALPGIFTALGTAASDATGWHVASKLFAGLNLAVGGFGMYFSYLGRTSIGAAIFGVHLGIGTLNLGLSLFRALTASKKVAVVPIAGNDARGQLFAGVAVRVVAF